MPTKPKPTKLVVEFQLWDEKKRKCNNVFKMEIEYTKEKLFDYISKFATFIGHDDSGGMPTYGYSIPHGLLQFRLIEGLVGRKLDNKAKPDLVVGLAL